MNKAFLIIALALALSMLAWGEESPPVPPVETAQPAGSEVAAPIVDAEPAEETPAEDETQSGEPQGWHISNWKVNGRLDYRLMNMNQPDMSTTKGELMAGEIESTATISNKDRDVLDLALQFPYLTQMKGIDDRGKEMHFGNAYGVYKFGLGKPNLRFGQFVVPFGNLTYYETHTRPLQSLYPESLGVRIDRGVSLEGMAGNYDYWAAAMNGNGPRGDNNGSPIVVGRVARRYDLANGTLNAGVSALYGKDMPRFSTLVDPLMDDSSMAGDMGMPALDFTDKSRLGIDAEYSAGPNLWRAELVAGRDGDGSVNGQFLQWNRAIDDKHEVSLQATRWEQPGGTRVRLGASAERKLDQYSTIRLYAERALGHTPMEDRNGTTIGIQYLREFPSLFGK